VEEELNSARHSDTTTEGRPKAPVAGCLDCGSVEKRCHTMGQPHARNVSLAIYVNVHRDVAARTAGGSLLWVRRLLLFQHLRWLDRGCFRGLSMPAGLRHNQSAESERNTRAVLEKSGMAPRMEKSAE
jgi:hypothetical protein